MDERLLEHYNTELRHLREMAAEFAREFPKVAGRLGLDKDAKEICPDPYVERLIEGCAWLAARVHLKLDAEFPRFTQSLLEILFPQYLAPIPSMAIVRFEPDAADPSTAPGLVVPRGTAVKSLLGKGERTACTFTTAHSVRLLPVRVAEARYFARDLATLNLPAGTSARAALRLRLQSTAPLPFADIRLDPLRFFLRGADDLPYLVYECLFSQAAGLVVQTTAARPRVLAQVAAPGVHRVGFEAAESVLPPSPRGFEGYRLLREYFTFPARFLFFDLAGFGAVHPPPGEREIDLIVLLREPDARLENRISAGVFELFCTPAVNLFSRLIDRVQLSDRFTEFQVVADRNRPLDFEIYDIEEVTGIAAEGAREQVFKPFYLARDGDLESGAFYTVNRVPRVLSAREQQFGRKSSYAGTEVYLSLVDAGSAPYRTDLRQLGLRARCTNRHLPISIALGTGRTDFTTDLSLPITAIRCLSGPTVPRPSLAEGRFAWRLISHLSLNYLSLLESAGDDGASALREILRLYTHPHDRTGLRQIEGLRRVRSQPVVRRVPGAGPVTFARGLGITLEMDEPSFEGAGAFLLAAVLEEFFARYVSLNSFTETALRTVQRGEVMKWTPRIGRRHLL